SQLDAADLPLPAPAAQRDDRLAEIVRRFGLGEQVRQFLGCAHDFFTSDSCASFRAPARTQLAKDRNCFAVMTSRPENRHIACPSAHSGLRKMAVNTNESSAIRNIAGNASHQR